MVASNIVFISGESKMPKPAKIKNGGESEMVTHAVNHFGSRPSTTVRSGKVLETVRGLETKMAGVAESVLDADLQ